MWWFETEDSTLKNEIKELKKEKVVLKEQLEELKLTKKMELKEVEHLVKMAKEKNAIEFERQVAEIEKKHQSELGQIQKKYYETQMADLKSTTEAILKRLPDITMAIEKKI